MLQAIRERITGVVAIFVLGLLAVPFLFFGVESYIRAVPQDAVAVVGDDEISSTEFQTSFARFRAEQRQQQGEAYDEIATNQPSVRREHLEGMIDQLLLRQYAESLGLSISDGQIAQILLEIPAFQANGQFDPELYRQIIRGTGRTVRGFEQELRDDLLVSLVPSTLSASAVVTEAEIDRMISLRQETRQLSWVEIAAADFRDEVEISEADIEAYYQDNTQLFMTEEQVRLAFLDVDARNMTDGLSLDEEELRNRYEAARQRYMTPEARRASHILISTGSERSELEAREKVSEILARLDEGESFESLAETYSDDTLSAEQGGDLGFVSPGEMVEPFEDALFELAEAGAISDVVETRFGLHLIRLDEIRPPQGMSFDEAREEILAEYIERESEGRFIDVSERLVDLIFADDSNIESIGHQLAVDVEETEVFGRSGGSGIARQASVIAAAFSDAQLLDRRVSDPIELDRNRSVVIQVIEHFPAEPRPLGEVREQITERLLTERATAMARERAESLLAQARSESLESVAGEAELELQVVDAMARFDFQHGFDLVSEVFRLPAPRDGASLHVLPRGDGFVVARLDGVTPGNPAAASSAERAGMRQQLLFAQMGSDVAALLEYLRANTSIRVLEDRL
ncbi:MAG: SurA N-terminal domain-containing protein [Wenzhouxiangella sp.]